MILKFLLQLTRNRTGGARQGGAALEASGGSGISEVGGRWKRWQNRRGSNGRRDHIAVGVGRPHCYSGRPQRLAIIILAVDI